MAEAGAGFADQLGEREPREHHRHPLAVGERGHEHGGGDGDQHPPQATQETGRTDQRHGAIIAETRAGVSTRAKFLSRLRTSTRLAE